MPRSTSLNVTAALSLVGAAAGASWATAVAANDSSATATRVKLERRMLASLPRPRGLSRSYCPACWKRNGYVTTTTPPPLGLGKIQVRTRPATHMSSSELPTVDCATDEDATDPTAEMTNCTATLPFKLGKRASCVS